MREERLSAVWARLRRIAETGDPSLALETQALTEARQLAEVLHTSIDDVSHIAAWYALGWFHFYRYLALPDGQGGVDLDAAVKAFTPCFLADVNGLPEPLLPQLAHTAGPQATALLKKAVSTDPDLLSAAVDLCRRIADAIPTDDPKRLAHLHNLGAALRSRFQRSGMLADLDDAVAAGRAAVEATPTDHPRQAAMLSGLGNALRDRFEQVGDLADVHEAIHLLRAAAEATPTSDSHRAVYLSTLGAALSDRFERSGVLEDLDDSIAAGRAAVEATPANHPHRARHLSNLGAGFHLRFQRVGDLADVHEAIDLLRAAAEATPTSDPRRAVYLSNLGGALSDRFERSGVLEDLDDSIAAGRAAVEATPANHPHRARHLSNLGVALRSRFERSGMLADLDDGIAVERAAVEATPANHPQRAAYLSNLGGALRSRFQRSGVLADLDDSIAAGRAAVEATPTDHPDQVRRLSALGMAFHLRFERVGDVADVHGAIDLLRATVEATPSDHPERAAYLSNLGAALYRRFERSGVLADLDHAFTAWRAAVQATPADHPERAAYLSNLGAALYRQFQRSGVLADLDDSIAVGRAAVAATPAEHPRRAMYLSNFGAALRSRFERSGVLADLDHAVTAWRAAVAATPTDHPQRAMYLSNLGGALQVRFEASGGVADLDDAVTVGRAAVAATPTEHPERAVYLSNLGRALRVRFRRGRERADLDAAASALDEVWGMISAAPSNRIQAAWDVARLVAGSDAGRAADAVEAAVRLLPEVTPRQLGRGDQQHVLGQFAGLAGDAAAMVLADPRGSRQKNAARALRLLEAGRAVLLSQALDTRSDLTDLIRRRPDLAARFIQLRDQIDQPTDTPAPAGSEENNAAKVRQARTVPDRHQLAHDFAQTLDEIRALEGFASFALPPTTEELLTEAEEGPVVVFNVSRHRSDALLLTRSGITHVELRHLTTRTLIEKVTAFHRALHAATSGDSREQRREAQDILAGVLQWLWDTAAGPVLEVLGHGTTPSAEADWPRVWWVPGGLLGRLPVHAAGYHTDPADDPRRRTVMDRVSSSYTPTVRALRHARQRTPLPDTPAQGLIVAMPTTPGLPGHGRLHHVDAEAELLRKHLPRTVLLREPDPAGPDSPSLSTPTKAAVLDRLPTCSIAHFACHGTSHPTDPSRSRLLLHDHDSAPLTVASLAPVRLDHAQLAYLSACRTAAIDTADLVDEAIHLTSAFQLAGFPHVVGTLWEIDDQTAVTMADAFYTRLRTPDGTIDTSRAAWALNQAVRNLRDGYDLPAKLDRTAVPFLWAAYLHAGA
ncbi:CHAT domain-containing protein [Streptomyces mirabilis]